MTRNSRGTTRHEYREGMVVVCIHDHQQHGKLNYLNRYTVQSVVELVLPLEKHLSGVCLEFTGKDGSYPVEWFIPEWYYKGKGEPMAKRNAEDCNGNCLWISGVCQECGRDVEPGMIVGTGARQASIWDKADYKEPARMDDKAMADPQPVVKRTDQAQQFQNVPDLSSLADAGKLPANPKQVYGDKKPRLTLAPMSAQLAQVEAHTDGMLKYGEVNWRTNPVEALTYIDAGIRHLRLYENGENYARDTKVKNLGAVMACCAILIDAELHGTLIDNRKYSPQTCDELHERGEQMVAALRARYGK